MFNKIVSLLSGYFSFLALSILYSHILPDTTFQMMNSSELRNVKTS